MGYTSIECGFVLAALKLIPTSAIVILAFVPSWKVNLNRNIALGASLTTFLLGLVLWAQFDPASADWQGGYTLSGSDYGLWNFSFSFGLDGLNIWLVQLTTFLTALTVLLSWLSPGSVELKGPESLKLYMTLFLTMEVLLLITFTARDLFVFYLFFEAVLLPMFLLVGVYGSRPRNVRAAYKMFLVTLMGSFPMLAGILMVYAQTGGTDWTLLCSTDFSPNRQLILWLLMFLSFGVKTPLVPLHGWLPETHTNAPTGGSVMLAGILLKLGTYGFMRWSLSLFPFACVYFSPGVYVLCLIGIVYVSLITLRQVDVKKVIAYSSVAHMGTCVLGMYSFNVPGLEGSLLMMIGHGLVSPGLFLCVGLLYDRYKTRLIHYYGGLAQPMPLYCTALLVLTMGNISLPVLSPTFAAELLVFTGVFHVNKLVSLLAATSMVLSAGYALFLYARLCFGNPKSVYGNGYCDLNRREFAALLPFLVLSLSVGLAPGLVLDTSHASLAYVLLSYPGRV